MLLPRDNCKIFQRNAPNFDQNRGRSTLRPKLHRRNDSKTQFTTVFGAPTVIAKLVQVPLLLRRDHADNTVQRFPVGAPEHLALGVVPTRHVLREIRADVHRLQQHAREFLVDLFLGAFDDYGPEPELYEVLDFVPRPLALRNTFSRAKMSKWSRLRGRVRTSLPVVLKLALMSLSHTMKGQCLCIMLFSLTIVGRCTVTFSLETCSSSSLTSCL